MACHQHQTGAMPRSSAAVKQVRASPADALCPYLSSCVMHHRAALSILFTSGIVWMLLCWWSEFHFCSSPNPKNVNDWTLGEKSKGIWCNVQKYAVECMEIDNWKSWRCWGQQGDGGESSLFTRWGEIIDGRGRIVLGWHFVGGRGGG